MEHGIKMGRDALFDRWRQPIAGKERKRKVQTTYSNRWMRKYLI